MSRHRASSSSSMPQPAAQRLGAARGQQRQQLAGDIAQPRHHDVGVGVVAQPALRRIRVLLVELVRAHHAVDLIALALGIEVRDRCPEAGDLEHHLRAIVAQERLVMRGLEVVPDVVEDRRVDVPLVMAEVRLPAARNGVEMDALGLLGALAAALPREHRAPESCLPGRRPGLAQPAVAVHQQTSRDLGQPDVEERKRVDLVPEHMPAVRLPVQAAGGQPGIEVGGVPGADLQDVRDVQPQQQLHALVSGHPHVAHPPQLLPRRARAARTRRAKSVCRAADVAAFTSVSLTAGSREVKNVTIFSTRVGSPWRTSKARTCWM